jgi:hypothetical protein
MTRRPTWLSAAAIGGAIALAAVSAAPVFAQTAPEAPPAGGYSAYPEYAEVACDGTFNGAEYSGNIAKIGLRRGHGRLLSATRTGLPRCPSGRSPSTTR